MSDMAIQGKLADPGTGDRLKGLGQVQSEGLGMWDSSAFPYFFWLFPNSTGVSLFL